MLTFLEWLNEATNDIVFGGFWKDGHVVVYIRGKRYVYITDAMYHGKWRLWSRYAPGKVLNDIKSLVKMGSAKQIEPMPVKKLKSNISEPKEDSCPNCRTPEPHYIPGIECPGCGLNTSEEN